MNIRAQAIGLMPEVEQNCMQDLATCKNPEIKGEVRKNLKMNINFRDRDIKTGSTRVLCVYARAHRVRGSIQRISSPFFFSIIETYSLLSRK